MLKWVSRPLPRTRTNREMESHSIKGRLTLGSGILRQDIGATSPQNLHRRTISSYLCALQWVRLMLPRRSVALAVDWLHCVLVMVSTWNSFSIR